MSAKQINETRLGQFISAGLDSRHYSGSLGARERISHGNTYFGISLSGYLDRPDHFECRAGPIVLVAKRVHSPFLYTSEKHIA